MIRAAAVAAVLVLGTVTACGGGGDDEPLPTGPITARLEHYDYAFDLESRRATAAVTATIETGGDCFQIPYRAGVLEIDTVMIDGVLARSVTVDNDIANICGAGYAAGTTVAITGELEVELATLRDSGGSVTDVGYSVSTDRWGNSMYYLVSWVNGCDRFGPCDRRPDVFATYTFTVTHPAGVTVNCPGTITNPDATTTRCDFAFPGGPTYSTFGLIGSTGYTVTDFDFAGIATRLYDHDGSGVAARIDAAYHGGFLDFMRDHFGPFPYGTELRVVTGPTYWSGFEHPGNIVLDDRLGTPPGPTGTYYKDPLAHILNHELAHQWAGDQTTLADTYDFVWKESMAEYLTYVYEDQTDPDAALRTRRYWKAASAGAAYFPVPEDATLPALVDYYGYVYGPGPLILFLQIEKLSSREAVLTAIESLLGTPRALSVAEVETALADATGLDLDAYFAAWVHGAGAPAWPRIRATYDGGTGMLTVSQTNQASGVRPCKFKVELRGDAVGDSLAVDVDTFTNGPDQVIAVTPAPAFPVTQTVLDPDFECLVQAATTVAKPLDRHPWRTGR
jgi:aminopeptidase N